MSTLDHAFFYNSDNHDRVYDADSFEHLLKRFFTTGVFTGSCQASAPGSGMLVQMGAGYSNVDGKVRFFQDVTEFALENAHATYNRIDTIVIERNDIDRDITAKVVTGSYSAQPVATAPVREGGIYQLIVAEIYVAGGAVRITNADITDKRPDTSVCSYVLSAVQTPDFSELFAQFQQQTANYQAAEQAAFSQWRSAQESDMEDWETQTRQDVSDWIDETEGGLSEWKDNFETAAEEWYEVKTDAFADWFESIRGQLDSDAAGHLQNEIDAINAADRERPWVRPVGIMTDHNGDPVMDFEGNAISITTLSQAELAAGVINSGTHY